MDEKALVKALQQGQIAGAGLDVFEFEPAIEKELTVMDNVVIVPHIASALHRNPHQDGVSRGGEPDSPFNKGAEASELSESRGVFLSVHQRPAI